MSRGDFDWSPWLEQGEVVVWSAKPNMLPLWIMCPSAIAICAGVYLGIHDGSAKASIAVAMAPWIIGILFVTMLGLLFVRNYYCATNRRIMTLHFAPWRRKPKLRSIGCDIAELVVEPRRPTMVRSRESHKLILGMNLSKNDEASLLELVKQKHT